jgi:hypothetical protein
MSWSSRIGAGCLFSRQFSAILGSLHNKSAPRITAGTHAVDVLCTKSRAATKSKLARGSGQQHKAFYEAGSCQELSSG